MPKNRTPEEREAHKKYNRQYYLKHKEERKRVTPEDRLQVVAFKSFFRVFTVGDELSNEEAFLKALDVTNDEMFKHADKSLVQKWINGEFEKAKDDEDYYHKQYVLSLRQPIKRRLVI